MEAFSTKTVHDILVTPSWSWMSMERQHFLVWYIGWSRHCTDIWALNWTTDRLSTPKSDSQNEKHQYHNNWYCNLQRIETVITGYWMSDFDWIPLSNCKSKRIISIYRRIRWTTCWQRAQFRRVGRFPSNCTRIHIVGLSRARSIIRGTFRFGPEPSPETTVLNSC